MRRRAARILVVEDDVLISTVLVEALRTEGWKVRAEPDGREIGAATAEFEPHLAILDVRLPVGPDGYEIARALRDVADIPILFLTAADSPGERLAGFTAGGDDYVTKPFSTPEVMARVHAILRRSGMAPADVWDVAGISLDQTARTVTAGDVVIDLRETEYSLLWTMSRNPGRVFSKVDLLRMVWRHEANNTNVVEAHVSSLRRKLEAHGLGLIHTVYGRGYVFRP